MTETIHLGNGLPPTRERPLDPSDVLAQIRAQAPIAPFTFADGHAGWLVTGYAQAKAILTDPRFSARAEYSHPAIAGERAQSFNPADYPPGMFSKMDGEEHSRFRKLFAGQFTARRINELTDRITEVAEGHAKAMLAAGPPADLTTDFAVPVSSMVICELLGVPYEDRDRFEKDTATFLNHASSYEDSKTAIGSIYMFLAELVQRRAADPADDVLSAVVASGELSAPEVIGACLGMLIAGFEGSASQLALGMYTLLTNPEQQAVLRADESIMDNAVEELLRYLSVVKDGTQRCPVEDLEIDGVLLKKGETALVHVAAANRDPARFADPDRLDLRRTDAAGHLALGYGPHICLGQQLARVQMRVGYGTLLRTFPDLRLAKPVAEIPVGVGMALQGVRNLPVTWGR
ncbi:cytochrome P450 [Crossiella cryophila]|uniref:Cytochrome P450 n=1 Tax=Crossiella cryophila TaxID=43355 RepID=A0A7W7CEE8_9PSEU|nr:cytochrome P450 [Crossiella cryophila]MBB4678288.1 cytochrome P450 [Crossiella cryophila]